jgi:transcriptional regulator with XRE-family HTH domain
MLSPGERIQALRKAKNLTQEELAKNLECSKQSIYRYENDLNQMDTHTLQKTAQFFEVTADYLLGMSNQKNSKEDDSNDHYATFYVKIISGLVKTKRVLEDILNGTALQKMVEKEEFFVQ